MATATPTKSRSNKKQPMAQLFEAIEKEACRINAECGEFMDRVIGINCDDDGWVFVLSDHIALSGQAKSALGLACCRTLTSVKPEKGLHVLRDFTATSECTETFEIPAKRPGDPTQKTEVISEIKFKAKAGDLCHFAGLSLSENQGSFHLDKSKYSYGIGSGQHPVGLIHIVSSFEGQLPNVFTLDLIASELEGEAKDKLDALAEKICSRRSEKSRKKASLTFSQY